MGYLDKVKLKKEILKIQQKVRIHSQIGSIPELFSESKGNIHDLLFGDTYIMPIYVKGTYIRLNFKCRFLNSLLGD